MAIRKRLMDPAKYLAALASTHPTYTYTDPVEGSVMMVGTDDTEPGSVFVGSADALTRESVIMFIPAAEIPTLVEALNKAKDTTK